MILNVTMVKIKDQIKLEMNSNDKNSNPEVPGSCSGRDANL